LHHLLPDTERFTEGKRNCTTFLFGSMLYLVVYVIVMNLRLAHGECMDSVRSALVMAWIADCAAVGFIYKCYYGRSMLHEVAEVADLKEDQRHWVYDEATHKYHRPSPSDIERRLADKARDERIAAIDARKREIRAAKVIQRWWRSVLYTPPRGILYLRARERFEEAAAVRTGV
jgi:hypothetical protein